MNYSETSDREFPPEFLKIETTGQFKKDYKLAIKRGCNPEEFKTVVKLLRERVPLPPKYRDHPLNNSKDYKGMRECHIEPNWLLVYKVFEDRLILRLIRMGSHTDLFS